MNEEIVGEYTTDEQLAEKTWSDAKSQRLLDIKNSITNDMKGVIAQLAEYQHAVTTAKTSVKKQYYTKKINKIRPQVLEMLAMTQRIDMMLEEKETASDAN